MRIRATATRLASMLLVACIVGCSPWISSQNPDSEVPRLPTDSPEFVEAVRFREGVGLRSDRSWIEMVQRNPLASSSQFGVPLMPMEIAELDRRARNVDEVAPVVQDYAQDHGATFAGLYVDHQVDGSVVALFVGDVADHEAALRARLHPTARLRLRQVQYSLAELEELSSRLASADDWFATAMIELRSSAIDIPTNTLNVLIFSLDPQADNRLRSRFGAPDMMTVDWDEDELARLPRGSLEGRVVNVSGLPLPPLEIEAVGDISHAEPDEGFAYGVREDGSFEIPKLAAMGWVVRVIDPQPGQGRTIVGTAHVPIVGNTVSIIEIEVDL